jgi:hypothetical protein
MPPDEVRLRQLKRPRDTPLTRFSSAAAHRPERQERAEGRKEEPKKFV